MDVASLRAGPEGQARLLLLIDAFSGGTGTLQGRVKLAKLDFLLRYPAFFRRAMEARGRTVSETPEVDEENIDRRMVRYRYGPWDPAYYALLGALFGRGLIETVPEGRYTGIRTTAAGREVAAQLAATPAWSEVAHRARQLRTAFRAVTGTTMKDFVYQHFPEVTQARWGEEL
jgi:hypothetical protein